MKTQQAPRMGTKPTDTVASNGEEVGQAPVKESKISLEKPRKSTPPPLCPAQKFTAAIAAIYNGKRSKPGDLYEPLGKRPSFQPTLGTVEDPIARELLSLSRAIENESRKVDSPKRESEVQAYKATMAQYAIQRGIAEQLFWQQVFAANPELDRDKALAILSGWVIVESDRGPRGIFGM